MKCDLQLNVEMLVSPIENSSSTTLRNTGTTYWHVRSLLFKTEDMSDPNFQNAHQSITHSNFQKFAIVSH